MPTRLIIVGGFLGAGKTTLLLKTTNILTEQGYRVGLVTNDQGQDLVDTALVAQQDIPVTEVAGGCFCCRFPDLMKALHRLQETVQPDIILAEPVGSCTDLMATIVRPLQVYYPEQFQIAPLTILLDAQRNTAGFPATVTYLYHKQLAEADIIALNKSDLLEAAGRQQKVAELKERYPHITVMSLSARSGEGLAGWLETTLAQMNDAAPGFNSTPVLDLDYAKYAEAEAALGWLNAKGTLIATKPFGATTWMTDLLHHLATDFARQAAAIAHLKISLKTPRAVFKASLTQLGQPISWDLRETTAETNRAQFILNARVNIEPRQLEHIVRQALTTDHHRPDFRCDFTHFECFSPLPPQPTYRLG